MGYTITGEYWFDERGDTMYADGDSGDYNHERYVIEKLTNEILDLFGMENCDECDLSDYEEPIITEMMERETEWCEEYILKKRQPEELEGLSRREKQDVFSNDYPDSLIEYLTKFENIPEKRASDMVMIALNSSRDAREYAIKYWGWMRVHGNHVEIQKLTAETLKNLYTGISNALFEEGDAYYDSSDDWDVFENAYPVDEWDEAETKKRFEQFQQLEDHEKLNISRETSVYYVSTYTGKRYSITLRQIENGEVSDLERSDIEMNGPTAATRQVRQMDLDSGPDYYKNKGIIGDSFKNAFRLLLKEYLP